jgi:hypothetical protein
VPEAARARPAVEYRSAAPVHQRKSRRDGGMGIPLS